MERGGAKRRMSQQEQVKATFQKIREKLNELEEQLQEMRKILGGKEKP